MLGILFYIIYFILFLCILTPFILKGKYIRLSLLPLLFYPHFNVTCFLKIGLTISFFELYSIALFGLLLIKYKFYKFKITPSDKIFGVFLIISLFSIVVAQIRILNGNLKPSLFFQESPSIRSLMSLNRFFVYPVILIYLREFYTYFKVDLNYYFKKYLAYSGFLPSIATILQSLGFNFLVLANNPSFSSNAGWITVGRPCGLTNESSFFAFMLIFSFIGIYYCIKENIISEKRGYLLYLVYFLALLMSISRTGMLILFIFILQKNIKHLSAKKIIIFICIILCISNISFQGFNILERFSSSFNYMADLSTIERYGSTEAILKLALDKSLLLGIGIYNYTYYIHKYLPDYLYNTIHYANNDPIASFNFILQLIAEWGGALFLFFIIYVYKILKKSHDTFISNWFIYLSIFALSFQILNFSLPFLILLYPIKHENSICH